MLLAALLLLPAVAPPVAGSFHEAALVLPDRVFVLTMQGVAFNGMTHPDTPLLEAYLGEKLHFTVVVPPLAEAHTFHLHGHPWLATDEGRVIDTVLVKPGETHSFDVHAGGVDRHAGEWMYHCHIADHQANGMWGILRVYPYRARLEAAGPAMTVTLDRLGEAVDGATLTLDVDGAPVAAHVAPQGRGAYVVHAALPATGLLSVRAVHEGWGESVVRTDLATGAPVSTTALATGVHAHGG